MNADLSYEIKSDEIHLFFNVGLIYTPEITLQN